ncbi:hypothetical protein GJ744_008749 [Endocarpon pusillum]|uniref:Uncharacterized protein n=1 Tax=Endocarpon pusillum TaxID=364733 RepID=A0A8H7AYH3_9EURO|nr:hypothetical protein GJ744_008749 [Endocarpon pusillum]
MQASRRRHACPSWFNRSMLFRHRPVSSPGLSSSPHLQHFTSAYEKTGSQRNISLLRSISSSQERLGSQVTSMATVTTT